MRSGAPLPAPTKCTMLALHNGSPAVPAPAVRHRTVFLRKYDRAGGHRAALVRSMTLDALPRRASNASYNRPSFKMRSASSHVAQSSISSARAGGSPSAAACAAMSSMRQSPNFECVFHMPPASFTSLPMCPTSSAPRKPSSRQAFQRVADEVAGQHGACSGRGRWTRGCNPRRSCPA